MPAKKQKRIKLPSYKIEEELMADTNFMKDVEYYHAYHFYDYIEQMQSEYYFYERIIKNK